MLFAFVGLVRWIAQRGRPIDGDVRAILIIRVDLMGDLLFALPAVQALRRHYPEAHLALLTLPYTASLAAMSPAVDEVIAVDTNRIRSARGLLDQRTWRDYGRVLRLVRGRRFDVAVSIYGRMGSLCAFFSGAHRTIGYAREAYPLLLNDPVAGGRHAERIHETEYAGRLIKHLGVHWESEQPQILVTRDNQVSVQETLAGHGVSPRDRLVAIHAGSVNGSAKRWPAANWAQFADELISREGVQIVLIGSESDRPIADEVLLHSRRGVISLVGETDLPGLAALISLSALVAGGDSGPLHLAATLGRPLLAAYGPTDSTIYGPQSSTAGMIVNRADIPCSPCYTLAAPADCPLADPICMRLITVARMVADARGLLGDR